MKPSLHKLTTKDMLPKHIFRSGQLIYEKSGHTLIFSNGYFICSKKCKKLCNDKTELSIKYRNLEKKFAYLLPNFKIPKEIARDMFYELDKIGVDLRKDIEKDIRLNIETMDATLVCAKQNLAKNGKISPFDTNILKEEYYELLKIGFPGQLVGISQSLLKLLGMMEENRTLVQKTMASVVIKNIYLTNDGKISKIKLEGWCDFLFKLVESKVPGYLKNIENKIVDRMHFDSLDFNKAIETFSENNFKDTLSCSGFDSNREKENLFKDIDQLIKNGTSAQYFNFWYNVRDGVWKPQEPNSFSDIYIFREDILDDNL